MPAPARLPALVRQAVEPPVRPGSPAAGGGWEEPAVLLAMLDELGKHESTKVWAVETGKLIKNLGPAISKNSPETGVILARLGKLNEEAALVAGRIADRTVAQNMSRAGHALDRRLAVWTQFQQMGGLKAASVPPPTVDPRSISLALAQIESITGNSPEGSAWRKYLRMNGLNLRASGIAAIPLRPRPKI